MVSAAKNIFQFFFIFWRIIYNLLYAEWNVPKKNMRKMINFSFTKGQDYFILLQDIGEDIILFNSAKIRSIFLLF